MDWLPWDHNTFVSTCPASESTQAMNASTTVGDVEAIAAGGMPTNWSSRDYAIFLSWATWSSTTVGLDLNDNTNFGITPSTHTLAGLGRFLSEAVPILLIELLVFEIIRRGLYYVVIGKAFPKS